jgi:hypothetical protein
MNSTPTVIAIHGGPGLSKEYFEPLRAELDEYCTFITYTQGNDREIGSKLKPI